MKKKITYSKAGVNYKVLDSIKKQAQKHAESTSSNLKKLNFSEVSDSRGESAYVWQQGNILMASVIEGLGTKSLVADEVYYATNKSYYSNLAHDTVATIINDLLTVGATPICINAYWAQSHGGFLTDPIRMKDFLNGWEEACNIAEVSWGGGETPTLSGIIKNKAVDLGGSAVGIIQNKENLITDGKIKIGDRIVLIKSNGINANGITLTRALAKKLPKGFSSKILPNLSFGVALLTKSNIYVKLIGDLQDENIDIHYISNITGHGLRKIMRAKPSFSYLLEKIFKPQPVFDYIAENANLNNYEMYRTFNMGQDYALFISSKDVNKCLKIISKNKFEGLDAGYVEKGDKQVVINPLNLVFNSKSLDLR